MGNAKKLWVGFCLSGLMAALALGSPARPFSLARDDLASGRREPPDEFEQTVTPRSSGG